MIIVTIHRFLLAFSVQFSFRVFEQPRPRTWLCRLETRSGVGVTGFTDVGFGGSHREARGLEILNGSGRPAPLARCVWYCECLICIPRVHYTTHHITDTSSSAGTPELIHVHINHTSDPQPPPSPQDSKGSSGPIAHNPGVPTGASALLPGQ